MAALKSPKPLHVTPADTTAAVDAFMAGLSHPQKDAIEALRKVIRGAAPSIREGVKGNAPRSASPPTS